MNHKIKYLILLTGLALSFTACKDKGISEEKTTAMSYTDVTSDVGMNFKYTFGDTTYENILESSGSGVSVIDFDNDGDMDLYMLNGTYLEGISDDDGMVFANTPNRLFSNNGDGTFTDVTGSAGVGDTHWSMAAATVDFDNDNDTDIYLLNYGPNVFYLNNGDGTFTDIADSLGLVGPDSLNGYPTWSVSAAFWDYNSDGALDVMLGNFLAFDPAYFSPSAPDMMPHPAEYKGQASLLYQQQADGSFTDVTKQTGFYYPDSKCMGLTVFDYDHDGDMDLFQGNDHQENFLFQNDGAGNFKEVGKTSGVVVNDQGHPTGSMHGTIGDVDGDGLADLLVTDLKYGALYRNAGKGLFEDITARSGVAREFAGKGEWYAALFDYDNDGDLDIFSANGTAEELIVQLPLLLENDGKGNFKNVGPEVSDYFTTKRSGRGGAVLDYDNDGDLDIVVSHLDGAGDAVLLRNDGSNKNHWLGLELKGKNGAASAIGATVTVYMGDMKLVRVNQWGNGYMGFNDPRVHFGLGQHEKVDKVEVLWADGDTTVLEGVEVDRYMEIKQ